MLETHNYMEKKLDIYCLLKSKHIFSDARPDLSRCGHQDMDNGQEAEESWKI